MIKEIKLNNKSMTIFTENKVSEKSYLDQGYDSVSAYHNFGDKVLVIFEPLGHQDKEFVRRNVLMLDENGKEIWKVQDRLEIWTGEFLENDVFIRGQSKAYFTDFDSEKNILMDNRNAEFSVDIETGKIEFLRVNKF